MSFFNWKHLLRGDSVISQAAHLRNKLQHITTRNVTLPGARVVAQLVHVWVVLGHYGDGVALLADDEAGLLLRSVPQVDAIVLLKGREVGLGTES